MAPPTSCRRAAPYGPAEKERRPLSSWRPAVLFAAVAASESGFQQAVGWYGTLFGRPPDVVVHDREVMWQATDGGWLYVVVDPVRQGHSVVTMAVEDLDATLAQLAGRGIVSNGIEVIGDAGRKAELEDPDGNLVALIEVAAAED